jgi:phage terminase large subunit-like protein
MVPDLRANERPEKFDRVVQSWDTANKTSESGNELGIRVGRASLRIEAVYDLSVLTWSGMFKP